jgi:GTPase
VEAAWAGAADADIVVLLVDAARGRDAETDGAVAGLQRAGRRALLALNKIDLVERPKLLALAQSLSGEGLFDEVFMISALDGDGVADLKRHLAAAVPAGPWLYPEDQLAEMPERLLAAEITREQLFLRLRQELPYSLTVETEKWEERKDGSARLDQTIYVERDSQKAIVLGKGGAMVKKIGQLARAEMTRVLGRPIHLFLFVKVRENWTEDPERYRQMGLEFPR